MRTYVSVFVSVAFFAHPFFFTREVMQRAENCTVQFSRRKREVIEEQILYKWAFTCTIKFHDGEKHIEKRTFWTILTVKWGNNLMGKFSLVNASIYRVICSFLSAKVVFKFQSYFNDWTECIYPQSTRIYPIISISKSCEYLFWNGL